MFRHLEDDEFKVKSIRRKFHKRFDAKMVEIKYGTQREFGVYFPKLWRVTYDEPYNAYDDVKLVIYGRNISRQGRHGLLHALESLTVLH
ncbi:MAG: hypothetical protein EOP04_16625 [Proteobacteria bacterium]|nr:MAG: hypothetical protein EOP04_16625 [Pseudomonadota bacterium]